MPTDVIVDRIAAGAAIGVGATLMMDAWNFFLLRVFGVKSLNFCFLGRWLLHIPDGIFFHASIATSPEKRRECLVGWFAHYSIGIALAATFVTLIAPDWLDDPTFAAPLLYGLVTVALPFFLLQPALGLGVASSRTPEPAKARVKSLATHTVFGIGLFVAGIVVNRLTR